MTSVTQADSTVAAIRTKVRRLTASSSTSALATSDIDQYINTVVNQDFPYAIKLDQMRTVYTFYTQPNIDRYPVDVNYFQGFREPLYVDGIVGYYFKDRQQFFNMWPRWPTLSNPWTGDGTTQKFTFSVTAIPFLSQSFILGCVDTSGNAISVSDDGNGNLQYLLPNPRTFVPALNSPNTSTPPAPGMHNANTGNPGQNTMVNIGTVNYVTGACFVDFSIVNIFPGANQQATVRVSQYQTGRPYSALFWNNEITIRPVPKFIHKIELEAYQTPVSFLLSTDSPILSQWWQYIAVSAAIKILEDRQDMEGVQNLMPLFQKQEALVLERQSVEEIGQRNTTIFSGTMQNQGWNNGFGWGWY